MKQTLIDQVTEGRNRLLLLLQQKQLQGPARATQLPGPARMTARGALVAMFSLFFLGIAAADWLQLGSLTGLGFVAGCALAARYTKRDGLLTAVVTPPLLFMTALMVTETISSHADTLRRTLTSAGEGIVLTLASVAPWLFAGMIVGIVVAVRRGLIQSFRELRAEARAEASGPRDGVAARAAARTPCAPAPPRPR
jgi:hypothetical protein